MANVNKIRNITIRSIIVLASWGFIIRQVAGRDHLSDAWMLLTKGFATAGFWLILAAVVVLMMVNWLIEAMKWKKLMATVQEVGLGNSMKAVLTGITVSVFTPNRVGEFLGRVFSIQTLSPLRAILVTLVGSMSQLTVTIVAGSVGALIFLGHYSDLAINMPESIRTSVMIITLTVDLLVLMLFLNVRFLTNILRSLIPRRWRRIRSYVRVFALFHRPTLLIILSMSFLRYLVFTGQYLILLSLFGLSAGIFDMVMLIAVIWLVMAAIPSFALAELGIRSSVAVSVFTVYYTPQAMNSQQTLAVVAASSLLWIINIAVPALLGSAFISRLKLPSPFKSIFRS